MLYLLFIKVMEKSPYQILIRPIITEKAMLGTGSDTPTYMFEVAKTSNKREIRWAVEAAYGVKVKDITTTLLKGKNKYSRTR